MPEIPKKMIFIQYTRRNVYKIVRSHSTNCDGTVEMIMNIRKLKTQSILRSMAYRILTFFIRMYHWKCYPNGAFKIDAEMSVILYI